jgi:RNA polymerase-binding protein DksA
MFTEGQLGAYRDRLSEQLDQLRSDVAYERNEADEERAFARDEPADNSEESSAEALAEVRLALGEQQKMEIREVTAALQRLDDGTYGMCIDCAREVEAARLEAYPSAARCLHCQEVRESAP